MIPRTSTTPSLILMLTLWFTLGCEEDPKPPVDNDATDFISDTPTDTPDDGETVSPGGWFSTFEDALLRISGSTHVLVIDDLNGDGLQELAIFDDVGQKNTLRIMLSPIEGNAAPSIIEVTEIGRDTTEKPSACAADFDGDGSVDLALVANKYTLPSGKSTGAALLFRGPIDADRSAASPDIAIFEDSMFPSEIDAIVFGDVNGDGALDLLANGISELFIVHGPITENRDLTGSDLLIDGSFDSIVVEDFNGDGIDDVAASDLRLFTEDPPRVLFFYGPFEGTVSEADADAIILPDESISGLGHHLVSPGDLNADGAAELFVGAVENLGFSAFEMSDPGSVFLFLSPFAAEGTVANAAARFNGAENGDRFGARFAVGDIDDDGEVDLLAIKDRWESLLYGSPNEAMLFLGPFSGTVESSSAVTRLMATDTYGVQNSLGSGGVSFARLAPGGRARLLINTPAFSAYEGKLFVFGYDD